MQKRSISGALFLVFALFLFSGCNQLNARKAAQINDEIVAGHKLVMASLDDFIKTLESRDGDRIQEALNKLKLDADAGKEVVTQLDAPKCNSAFIPASMEMFTFYSKVSELEYSTIAGFYSRDSISYNEYDSLQVLIQKVEGDQQTVDQAFQDAQHSFARSCGFKLVRNVE